MANILAPFGFVHVGYMEGQAPTYGMRHRKIALGQTNPIFKGDPVQSLAGGYIDQPGFVGTPNATQITGIFVGCEYVSISQQRKVRSPYWPGSDALYDVDAFVIDADRALFKVQANGTPFVFGNVGNNVGYFIVRGGSTAPTAGSGQGNTVNGLSGALADTAGTQSGGSGAVNTTAGLPFRIYALFSDFVAQGSPNAGTTITNGADNTTNFNWAIVTPNNIDSKSTTGI
jgi:hypothetical protein